MSKKYIKGRIWACVAYPESLPDNWLEILQQTGLQIAISPLHDMDLDPDGNPKKSHYHIIFNYDGPATDVQVKSITDKINATIPIKLESLRGMYRYHLHLDNPDKYQYKDIDRTLLNGFNSDCNDPTKTEVDKMLYEIQQIIIDKHIIEYEDLMNLLHDPDTIQLWSVARQHTVFLNAYIKSKKGKIKDIILQ